MQTLDLKAIGSRFKSFRERQKLTHAELAKETGKNVKTLSLLENGHCAPHQSILAYMADKYKLNIDWVMTGLGDEINDKVADPSSIPNLHAKVILMERELDSMRKIMEEILEKLK